MQQSIIPKIGIKILISCIDIPCTDLRDHLCIIVYRRIVHISVQDKVACRSVCKRRFPFSLFIFVRPVEITCECCVTRQQQIQFAAVIGLIHNIGAHACVDRRYKIAVVLIVGI